MNIFATTAGEQEPPRGDGTLIDFVRSILPANDMARSITVVLCAFIALVLAPAALLSGILPIVREWRTQSTHDHSPMESRPRVAENQTEAEYEIERLRQDLKQTRERADRSEHNQEIVATYYSVLASGIFEERMAVNLARDRSGYSSIVSKINRVITAGPSGVSSELRDFLLILERFAADQYAIRDLRDYHDVKARVLKAMRQAIEADRDT